MTAAEIIFLGVSLSFGVALAAWARWSRWRFEQKNREFPAE